MAGTRETPSVERVRELVEGPAQAEASIDAPQITEVAPVSETVICLDAVAKLGAAIPLRPELALKKAMGQLNELELARSYGQAANFAQVRELRDQVDALQKQVAATQ